MEYERKGGVEFARQEIERVIGMWDMKVYCGGCKRRGRCGTR